MVRLVLLVPAALALEEDSAMLQHVSQHDMDEENNPTRTLRKSEKRGASAARAVCQNLCDPATQCTTALGDLGIGHASDQACQAMCQEGCFEDEQTCKRNYRGDTARILPEDYAKCQTVWQDESHMCDNTENFETAVQFYCQHQCTPNKNNWPKTKGLCTSTSVNSGHTNDWHASTCKQWCATNADFSACFMNPEIDVTVCGEEDIEGVFAELETDISVKETYGAPYDDTLWQGNCPAGYSFQEKEPSGRPLGYVARDKAKLLCDADAECCGISETSWPKGKAAGAHWMHGDMRRLGFCPKLNNKGKTEHTWQKAPISTWRSCRHDTHWAAACSVSGVDCS